MFIAEKEKEATEVSRSRPQTSDSEPPATKRRKIDVHLQESTSFLKVEHEMQMKVWESQLEQNALWKEEHDLRMLIMKKQYELLNSDSKNQCVCRCCHLD